MSARCGSCGGQVMAYSRYLFNAKPTAVCDACGARVHLRGFYWLLGAGVVLLAALVGVILAVETKTAFGVGTVVIVAVALVLDYVSYRIFDWDPVPQASK